LIARLHRLLEARIIDADEIIDGILIGFHIGCLERQKSSSLRQRFDHQYPWHDGMMRKVSCKKRFVDRYILERGETLSRFESENAIDEEQGVTVRKVFQNFMDIH